MLLIDFEIVMSKICILLWEYATKMSAARPLTWHFVLGVVMPRYEPVTYRSLPPIPCSRATASIAAIFAANVPTSAGSRVAAASGVGRERLSLLAGSENRK